MLINPEHIALLLTLLSWLAWLSYKLGRHQRVQEEHSKAIAEIDARVKQEVAIRDAKFEKFEERQSEATEKIAETLVAIREQLAEHSALLKHITKR